jgi:hypothetical protein
MSTDGADLPHAWISRHRPDQHRLAIGTPGHQRQRSDSGRKQGRATRCPQGEIAKILTEQRAQLPERA